MYKRSILLQDVSTDPSKLAAHQSNPKVRKVMEKLASKFGGAGGPMGGGFPDFPGKTFSFTCICQTFQSFKVTWVVPMELLQQIPMILIDLSHRLVFFEQRILFLFHFLRQLIKTSMPLSMSHRILLRFS